MGRSSPEYMKAWREENKDKIAAARMANKEKRAAQYKEWCAKNRDRKNELHRNWSAKNADKQKAKCARWYEENRDKARAQQKKYREENRSKLNALGALKRARKRNATPKWLSQDQRSEMILVYESAQKRSKDTGILHHVDHVVPLAGENVCGLHVPWNLQILTADENVRKGNGIVLPAAVEVLAALREVIELRRT